MGKPAGSELPGGHLTLAVHRAAITGKDVVQVMAQDCFASPGKIWQAESEGAELAGPGRRRGGAGVEMMRPLKRGERLAQCWRRRGQGSAGLRRQLGLA